MSSTAPAPSAPQVIEVSQDEEKALRRRARRRASFCPGAGWALLGYSRRGNVVLLCVAAWLLSIIWLVLRLSPASVWASACTTVLAIVVWSAEWLDTAWCLVRTPGEGILVRSFGLTTAVVWAAALALPLLMVRSFGSIEADHDERMAPAIEPGETLLYHRNVSHRDLKRGAIILFKLPPHAQGATPGEMVIGRILAGPDDDLTVRDGRYVVNDEETRYRAKPAPRLAPLVVPAYPRKLIVPDSRYFVVQDSLDTGIDSQQLDYARRMDIVSARLFHFGSNGIMRPVE